MKKYVLMVAFMVAVMAVPCFAQPVIPDAGVDVEAYVGVLLTALGGIIATVIGATFAIYLIRRAIGWVKGYVK